MDGGIAVAGDRDPPGACRTMHGETTIAASGRAGLRHADHVLHSGQDLFVPSDRNFEEGAFPDSHRSISRVLLPANIRQGST